MWMCPRHERPEQQALLLPQVMDTNEVPHPRELVGSSHCACLRSNIGVAQGVWDADRPLWQQGRG